MTSADINRAIWEGEYWGSEGAVALARRAYVHPNTSTATVEVLERQLQYVNALYSALGSVYPAAKRLNPRAVYRAVSMIIQLRPFVAYYRALEPESLYYQNLSADQKEMLGAILVKYATVPLLGGSAYRAAAIKYASAAFRESESNSTSHTAPLAALTLARAYLAKGRTGDAQESLHVAEFRVESVVDANQRARILRSIAELWSTLGHKTKALEFINRAGTVSGIGEGTWEKICEARIAIETS